MPQPSDKKPINAVKQKKMKDFFKAKGHKPKDVDALDLSNDDKLRDGICVLNKVTREQYQIATGV